MPSQDRVGCDDRGDAGEMTAAGSSVAAYLSTVTSECPASVSSLGGGCPGSSGSNTLSATVLPWIGSSFEASATGLPTTCVAVAVTGVPTTSFPLNLLPQGQPACDLLTSPDALALQLTTTGTSTSSVSISNDAAWIGQSLFHQVLSFELDPAGNIVLITGTNALAAIIGAL
ncbi:MAG: hypothetical protein AB8H80_20485 [Planctomycetota bacterium]